MSNPPTPSPTPDAPWTYDEIATLRESVAEQYRAGASSSFAASFLATIDAAHSQIAKLQRELAEANETVARLAFETIPNERSKVYAAEAENAKLRAVLELIEECGDAHDAPVARRALDRLGDNQ